MKIDIITIFPEIASGPLGAGTATFAAGTTLFVDNNNRTVGNDLTFEGDSPTHSPALADDGAKSLSGVITTAAANSINRISADHGISPNGGGSFVNQ